jgi:hypothetical protein
MPCVPVFYFTAFGATGLCRCGWVVPAHTRCDEASVRAAIRRHAGILEPVS